MSSDGSTVLYRSIPPHLRLGTQDKRELKTFVQQLSARVGSGRSFCTLITNNAALQKLNREFLDSDYPTDVLSFPSGLAAGDLGELAISIERAAEQAGQHGHGLLDELRILMLHGVLHLSGMDHERDRGAMARAERKLRVDFNLPSGLIARTLERQPAEPRPSGRSSP